MSATLQTQETTTSVKPSLTPLHSGVIQRKCDCGGSAGMSGECEECQEKQLTINRYAADRRLPSGLVASSAELARSMSLPDSGAVARYGAGHHFGRVRVDTASLNGTNSHRAISQPGDRSEEEADRAAATVMRALSSPVFEEKQEATTLSQTPLLIQRAVADENAPEMEAAPDATTEPETAAPEETPAPGLIVEDEASEVGPGQMRKSDFLARLNAAIYAVAEPILATRGRTAQSCPYIVNWIEYGYTRSGSYVETFIRRFALGSERVASAGEYIPLAVERLRRALLVWASTGEITGVPESLAGELPGAKQKSAVASLGAQMGAEGETAPTEAATGALQAKAREGGSANDADPHAVQNQLRAGEPLDSSMKTRMESAFGYDFSRVRIHRDANAAHLSTSLNARAFTIGSDIAFGAGEYQPGTLVGDAILAHELAHVVQQGGASMSNEPLQKSQTRYGALEDDADNAAVGAVVSLWGGAKGKMGEISRHALPRLKSGLRLQRCSDCAGGKGTEGKKEEAKPEGKKEEAKPEGKKEEAKPAGATRAADVKCEPEAKTLDEISAIPGLTTNTFGYTKAAPISFDLEITSESGKCKLTLKDEPRLTFNHLVSVKAGDYKRGTVTIPFDPCKGKVGDLYYRVTADLAGKVKQGEIEHCEDNKLAFALSFERYAQAVKEVAVTGFPGKDVPACETEALKRLKEKVGVEASNWKTVADCLFNKTLERDKDWHIIKVMSGGGLDADKVSEFILDPSCASLTLKLDHTKLLPEVGKHLSKDVVKGCGEK